MTKPSNDITEAANRAFNGKPPANTKRPEDGKTVTEVNEAADAEFNDDKGKTEIGNQVGGLRGPSD